MTTVITSVTNTSGTNIDLATGQDLYVAPRALVASQTVYGILADAGGHAIDIFGAVYGEDAGIRLENVGSSFGNSRVLVGVGASVSGRVVGIESLASSHSISVAGIVSGNNGFEHSGGTFSLSVSGTIIGSFGNGVDVDSNFGTVVNTGHIESTFSGAGVVLDNTTTTGSSTPTLTNFGSIGGTSTAISGDISNSDTVLNYGEVYGDISVSGEDDFVLNAGTVTGEVRLGSGNDTFDGRGGTVSEQVEGGSGDDAYFIDDTTILLVELSGQGDDSVKSAVDYTLEENFENLKLIGSEDINGSGNSAENTLLGNSGDNRLFGDVGSDVIEGRGGDDRIDGGTGNDTLNGGGGDDRIKGRASNDLISGQNGEDVMHGGSGSDNLTGGNGDDTLRGGGADDTLRGGNGDDLLIGGDGGDRLFGDAGRDVFRFNQANDSTFAVPIDQIRDFEVGLDRIQLTAVANAPLTMAIGGPFSGDGPSARTVESGPSTVVLVDVDGDATPDMRILVLNVLGLTEGDFIL